jgi:hypothetical protein
VLGVRIKVIYYYWLLLLTLTLTLTPTLTLIDKNKEAAEILLTYTIAILEHLIKEDVHDLSLKDFFKSPDLPGTYTKV